MSKTKKPNLLRKTKTAAPSAKLSRRVSHNRTSAASVDRSTIVSDDRRAPAHDTPLAPDDRVEASNLTLHQLFEQQTARMLERADLTEEQKQSLLIGMSCPCCGGGGFSFTAKLRRGD